MSSVQLTRTRTRTVPRTDGQPFAVRRFRLLLALGTLGVLALAVAHLAIGTVLFSPVEVVAALLGHPTLPYSRVIVVDLRLPRTLIAMAAGGMLGLSGALLQAVMRNPLAEPEMTGATSGAVLFAVLWLVGPGHSAELAPLLPLVALAGGLLACGAVYLLSDRGAGRYLILVGLLTSAVLRSVTSFVLLIHQEAIGAILMWLIGSLNARVWAQWNTLWPWALVALPAGIACARWANVLQLGDASGVGLGVHVNRARVALLITAALLATAAVSVVGGITFLGLVAPHIARRIVGADARRLFPASVLLGAAILLAADMIAQVVLWPNTLPVGAVLAVVGAPFFLYLLSRRAR
ncbi:MAG TPA: iron ABC transporter permease [Ktedonobacterales bacterium]